MRLYRVKGMTESQDTRRWTVGELASVTGVTVRALHYYDELGLLVPAERSGAGYRLYCAGDVQRLYRIVALRRLGFRLEEIASLLEEGGLELAETVRRHLERVEEQLVAMRFPGTGIFVEESVFEEAESYRSCN